MELTSHPGMHTESSKLLFFFFFGVSSGFVNQMRKKLYKSLSHNALFVQIQYNKNYYNTFVVMDTKNTVQ